MKKILYIIVCCHILYISHAQTNYNDLPLQDKISVKEGSSSFYSTARGTNPTVQSSPEQDCNSAIPVCQNVYTTSTSYSGVGANDEIPSNSSCLGSNERNSVWYTFSTSSAGNLAFMITPNSSSDDYDFALYDITGSNCSGISSGAISSIRCNYSATAGNTGLSSSGSNASEAASGPNQSSVLATTAGRTYVLVISNYSSSQSGYSLNFSTSTASIFDVTPPTIIGVTAPCGSNAVTFNASEQIKCSSIAANGSDFTITGTGGPYVVSSAAGQNCGINTAQITLNISPALSGAGPWTVGVVSGSDGNTLIDACGNAMAPQTHTFTTSPPTATITGPSSICKGSPLALTASNGSSYSWTGAAVPGGQQTQQTISLTPSTPGTLNFTVQVTNGTCGTSIATKAVTVNDAPNANFSVIPSLTVCAGASITFSNTTVLPCSTGGLGVNQCVCGSFLCNPTPVGGTFASYLWTFGDGGTDFYIFGAGNLNPTHTYTAPGTYNVNLNASTTIGAGCSNSKNVTITVLPATPNLTVSPTTTICPGQSSTLTVSGGTSYTWTPATTLSSASNSITIANPTITTTYSVSAPGCSGSQTSTVQVVVNGIPPVIGVVSGPTLICSNSAGLTYSVNNVAATNYTWSVPAGATITAGQNSNNITVNFGTTAGTVSVTAVGTCGIATASINVGLNPALNLTVTPTNTSVCAGSSTTLSASGATSYTWSPTATLSSANGANVTASPVTATIYTVIGSSGTCTGSATATISISAGLSLTASSNNATICAGSSALLNATGATNYTWSPAATLNSTTGAGVTATPLASTIYTVMGSTGTCTGVTTVSVGIGSVGCVSTACNLALIRSTLTGAGNIELLGMNNTCSLYFINPQFMTGPQAQAYAQTFGANLISVQSATENADLLQALSNQGFSSNVIWIGFTDAALEGTFVWYDSAPVTYSNWAPGEPNNAGGNENCTQIYPNGTWNDLNCSGYNSLSVIEVNLCPQVTIVNVPIHCPNTNVTLTASTLLGSPSYTYTWIQSGVESFTNVSTPGNTNSISVTSMAANTFTVFSEDRYACPQSASITLSVNPLPVISVNNSTICIGQQTATLNASGGITYTWTPAATLSSANGNPVTATPISTTIYTVTGTDANTCVNSYTSSVTVINTPTLTASSNATICPGASTTLSVSGAINYTWSPSVSLSSSSGSTVTANPSATTVYTITGTNSNGCTGTTTVQVTAASTPTLTSTPDATICPGSSTTITASGAVTYTWSPSTTLSSAAGTSVTANPTGATIYTITGANANGCISTATVQISVSSNPIITVSPGTTICPAGSSTLTAGGAISYTWAPAATLSTTSGTATVASPAGTTTYSVSGSNTIGCTSTNTVMVTVANNPTVTVSPNATVCPLAATTLTVGGATSYTWAPAIFLNNYNTATVVCTPSATTTYTVDGLLGTCQGSTTVTVVVQNTVVVTAAAVNATICPLANTSLSANGASTYTWSPSLTLSSANGGTVTATPPASITYTVIGSTSTCTNSAQVVITVTVNPVISATGNPSVICSGSSSTLTASGANSYTWASSQTLSSPNGVNVTASPNTTTVYTVTGTSPLGCTNFTTVALAVIPTPTISTSANPLTICAGQTSTINAFGATDYTWSPVALVGNLNAGSTIATPVTPGPTVFTVTGTNGISPFICTSTNTIQVNVTPNTTVTPSPSSTICAGEYTSIYAVGGTTYSWTPSSGLSNPGSATTYAHPASNTVYTVTATNNGLCPGSATMGIIVNPVPTVYAGVDTTVNIDESIVLHGIGNVDVGFLSPDGIPLICHFCADVTIHPQETTCYVLKGENSFGCADFDTVCVTVTKDWDVFIPNTFTPNSDNVNDIFIPVGYGISEIHLTVFDRWGTQIFKTHGDAVGWDGANKGKICEQGVYVYQVDITAMSGAKAKRTGHVTLLPKK